MAQPDFFARLYERAYSEGFGYRESNPDQPPLDTESLRYLNMDEVMAATDNYIDHMEQTTGITYVESAYPKMYEDTFYVVEGEWLRGYEEAS